MKTDKRFRLFTQTLLVDPGKTPGSGNNKNFLLNTATGVALRFMALQFKIRPSLRRYLKGIDGWIDFSVGFRTDNGSVEQAICFKQGRVTVVSKIPDDVDVTMRFIDNDTLKEMARSTPNEMLNLILKNRMILNGNMACLQLFSYYIYLILGKKHQRMLNKAHREDIAARKQSYKVEKPGLSHELDQRKNYRMKGEAGLDKGVIALPEPYLCQYSIDDFPRLKTFYNAQFEQTPEVCPERAREMTHWFRQNGFETDKQGKPWNPELRQALAFKQMMEKKTPVIRNNDLIAGTTTSHEIGVTVFPDAHATMFWSELQSVKQRVISPYICSRETAEILHQEVFPFWIRRNFREAARSDFNYPLCQKLDERLVAYFVWKTVGISHTIPDFPRLLKLGTNAIIQDIESRKADESLTSGQQDSLTAMSLCLEGINSYSKNLSAEAVRQAQGALDSKRKAELERLVSICEKVPSLPCQTLDEAMNAAWILWVGLHNENSNTGLSLGRLDQLFQPYFQKEFEKLTSKEEKVAYVEQSLELAGCFIMRLCDQQPLTPDISNYLFGGAGSTQAVTVGGITPDGKDGVNDMTYIFLKAVEMMPVRDANLNARFHPGINSEAYLKRLCEVNVITSATPIMHNDESVFKALKQHAYKTEEVNDWAATGCVEPTIQGRHFSHTGSILMNMVAPLEMALNDGKHPLMNWKVGPETGSIENGDFENFEDFFAAWETQQRFMIDQAVEYNNLLGKIHQKIRPTPLLSVCIDGCLDNAKDLVHGGARYNTSGTSNIGLADVTDSLLVIKKLVFDQKKVSFERLKKAIDRDFEDDPALHAMVQNKVNLFGSGDPATLDMADRVSKVMHDSYSGRWNYRGGKYTTGFWSMSQHVAYGNLSGTLPSGRKAGKAFTPGLTPSPLASKNYLDNIHSVAKLNPENMDNNIAFNVKLTPAATDSREQVVDYMFAYVKSYFDQGGMQMQFNMVTSETLKDAVANPENYRNLMVRISGYNAYFVQLNREIQIELIERAEYGLR
jgi:pyruvate formate-lyase/glycerol dehydratase family glycyl radical enzyme